MAVQSDSEERQMIPNFATCISPMLLDEFFAERRGKGPVHFPGTPNKYAPLLDTHDLGEVLSRLVVSPGIVRIRRPEGGVPADDFLIPIVPIVGSHRQVIRARTIEQQLKDGATLTVENCESHFANVHAMCSVLSEAFLARVYAFLFLVYEPERPCGIHWDSYDMFICQVAGCKKWPIYKPIYRSSLFDPSRSHYKDPPSELVQEFKLEAGDGLYIPRGWPHDPVAVAGPSLHVAFAITTPTGIDLLDWVRADLNKNCEDLRVDLPVSLCPSVRRAYAAKFREIVMNHLSDDVIDSFYEHHCLNVREKPIQLPDLYHNYASAKTS